MRLRAYREHPRRVPLGEDAGGEVAAVVREHAGRYIRCACGTAIARLKWVGYPHPFGLSDGQGGRWVMHAPCPRCHKHIPLAVVRGALREQERCNRHIITAKSGRIMVEATGTHCNECGDELARVVEMVPGFAPRTLGLRCRCNAESLPGGLK